MVELVILDVNETLLALDPLAERFVDVGLEGQFECWFAAVLRDGFAAALAGRHAAFADLARDQVAVLLVGHGVEPTDARIAHVLAGLAELRVHDDVADGLRRLADAGVPAVTLTNGSAAMTHEALERSGLATLVTAVHDVAHLGGWKPAPAPYRAIVDAHGCAPGRSALVAVHPWDVQGAQAAGLIGAWLDRGARPYPRAFPEPDVRASTFPDLVERLISRRAPS